MNHPDPPQDDAPKMSKGGFSFAAIGTLAASVSLILLLLGYGVSLAVETKFGIPHASLYDSPSDIIDLASVALMMLMTGGIKVVLGWGFYAQAYRETWPFLLLLIVIAAAGFGIGWWALHRRAKRPAGPRSKGPRMWPKVGPPAAVILSIALAPMLAGLVALAIVMGGMFVCILPILGLQAGKAHFDKWVIGPQECSPLPEDLNGRKGPFVDCVVVKKPSDDLEKPDVVLAEGRVVIATTKYIVLWIPKEHARRVPISDTVIEPVSSLRPAKGQAKSNDAQKGATAAPLQQSETAP